MKTGGDRAVVTDLASMVCIGIVDENIAIFGSELFFGSLGPMHCQSFLAEGMTRVRDWQVSIKIKIPHGMIKNLDDHIIWCCQISRDTHDGITKV
jgi:hypothetical protein